MTSLVTLFVVLLLALANVLGAQDEGDYIEGGNSDVKSTDDDDRAADVQRLKAVLRKQLTLNREIDRAPEIGRDDGEADGETGEDVEEDAEEDIAEENEQDSEGGNEETDEEAEAEEEPAEAADDDYDPYTKSFNDQQPDGSYVYGYSLPDGVRRYERASFSGRSGSPVVEGFYTQPRFYQQRVVYELRCYRSDAAGFHPLSVQYLERPPAVRRGSEPDVDCFE